MIGKKINQLATELAPDSTDLTIIGDPISGVSKKITLAQLGAIFSGAVSFYTNLAAFPVTGDINVIYCAKDTQKLYLWSGSAYVEVFPSQALLDTYQLRSEKGVSNGYASLDSAGKVPIAQLPSSIMEYKGTWNAATNTPTLANGTGDTGDVYICNVAGTVNFGAGAITFAVGDYVIYSGTIWQRSSGAVGTVTSVGLSSATSGVTIGSTPITTSGTITLAIATASGSAQGLLSSTDWTTFNSKQNALTNPVTGTGASGQVTFFNGTSTVTGTNNFFWDATNNRLGIGTTTPQRSIEIFNSTADNHLRLSGNAPSVSMGEAVTGSIYQAKFGLVTVNGQFVTGGVAGDFVIISQTGATIIGTSSTEKMRVQSSGNVSINNTNDTFKLDVTGTGRFSGQLRLESTITNGTYTYTLPSATGTLALTSDIPSLTGYVPYTGATANVDLGTFNLTADVITGATGSFASSGGSNTFSINHSSGSGIALNITKGGNGEGLYINKTSGSGNAATIIGTLNATTLVKSGGTSAQFLKADGSVDSSTYLTTSAASSTYLPLAGGTLTGALGGTSASFSGTLSSTGGDIRSDGTAADSITSGPFISVKNISNSYQYLLQLNATYGLDFWNFGGSWNKRMTLSASGNLGLGVTPSAWATVSPVFQIGTASLYGYNNSLSLSSNAYYNAGDKYIQTGFATQYYQSSGIHYWYNAPSGTAGNAISFTQAMTLGSNSGLSIGTTTAAAANGLLVAGAATFSSSVTASGVITISNTTNAYAYQNFGANTGYGWQIGKADNSTGIAPSNGFYIYDLTNSATRMVISQAGNVGIGTTSPNDKLDVIGNVRVSSTNFFRYDGDTGLIGSATSIVGGTSTQLGIRAANDMLFATSGSTERMRISSGGELYWNLTGTSGANLNTGGVLFRNNSGKYIQVSTGLTSDASLLIFYKSDGAGSVTNTGSISTSGNLTLYNTTSDYRLKEDFKDYNALNIIGKLKTYDFKWKGSNTRDFGMIAHELQEILPTYVNGKKDAINEDGSIKTQGVDYSKIVPVLIKAIQELNDKIK